MMKFMFVGRRAAGTTRKGALDHLRDVHAKMVVCPPPGAGAMPLDYVQNHVVDGAYPGDGGHAIERDLVTELWFESLDHLKASTATPYYLDSLRPDEPRFVEDASVAKMMVRPELLRDGPRGRFKAFLFVSEVFDAAPFLAAPGLGAAVRNVVLPPPGGSAPFVDLVLEGWFDHAEDATAAVEHFAADPPAGVTRARSFAVVAEEYDSARLRAHHGCAC